MTETSRVRRGGGRQVTQEPEDGRQQMPGLGAGEGRAMQEAEAEMLMQEAEAEERQ